MPRLLTSRKDLMLKEIMDNKYVEEKHDGYTKYFNENFDVLKQKSFYMVIDKRAPVHNVFTTLEAAHKNIVRCSA